MDSNRRRSSKGINPKSSASGPRRVLLEDDDVGKKVKESKKRITWQFTYDGDGKAGVHTVILFHSIVSGKRKIVYDNQVIYEHKNLGSRIKEMVKIRRSGLMDHAWSTTDGHLLRLSVDEKFDGFTYDLIVDGQPYSNMTPHPVYSRGGTHSRGHSSLNMNNNSNVTRSSYNDNASGDDFDSFSNDVTRKNNSNIHDNDSDENDGFDAFDAFDDNDAKKRKEKKRKKEKKKKKKKSKKADVKVDDFFGNNNNSNSNAGPPSDNSDDDAFESFNNNGTGNDGTFGSGFFSNGQANNASTGGHNTFGNDDDFWGGNNGGDTTRNSNSNANDGFGNADNQWENFNSNGANSTSGFGSFDQSDQDSGVIFASAPGRQDDSRKNSSYWDGTRGPSMMQTKHIPDTSSQSSSLASSQGTNNLFASTNGNTYANTDDLLGSFNGLEFNSGGNVHDRGNKSNSKNNNNNVLEPTAPNSSKNSYLSPSIPSNVQPNNDNLDPLLGLVNLNNIASPPGKSPTKAHNKPMNMMRNGGGAGMLTPTTSHIDKGAAINAAFKGSTPIQPAMRMGISAANNNNMMMMMQQQQQQKQHNKSNENPFDAFGL